MGYTKDAIKGVSWVGAFRIFFRVFSYIKLAIIARVLSPAQFGVADIAIIALAFVEVFTETGINVYLIQDKENINTKISTAWIVSIFRGALISLVILLSVPLVTSFFRSPTSASLLYLICFVPLLRGFINPSVVNFLKQLEYRRQFLYRSSISFIEMLVTVTAVLILKSPTGIVWGLVAGAVWELAVSFVIARPLPKLTFSSPVFKDIIRKGVWLTAAGVFDYLYLNLDNIVIGRILGVAPLALYMRAYSISMLPITEVSDVFNQTTFPIYVKVSDDRLRLSRAYLKTVLTVSLLVIPAGILFFLFPDKIIEIVLGENWIPAASVLQVLAFYGIIRAIMRTTIGLFYSMKRQDLVAKLTLISLAGLAATIIPFVIRWGIVGAGLSALFGTLIGIPFTVFYARQILNEKK